MMVLFADFGEIFMRITYIDHSGFLVETSVCYYLFDYYKGKLPCLDPCKSIIVFFSHIHYDHYNPEIFNILKTFRMQQIIAVLSEDISPVKCPEEITCIKVVPHQVYKLPCGTVLRTLLSTDIGVAFLLKCPDGTVYHAGDLNDWIWNGVSERDNLQMTGRYRHEINFLAKYQRECFGNLPLDIAFIPLDPRQEEYYAEGILYFLEKIHVLNVYPMHFWNRPEIIRQFLAEYPEYKSFVKITSD